MTVRAKWLGIWLYLPLSLSWAQTQQECLTQARSPLEESYCKIRAVNPSAPLPSLQELRKNPEKTQRLLLRRPAQQAGISLPPETSSKPRLLEKTRSEPAVQSSQKAEEDKKVKTGRAKAVPASPSGWAQFAQPVQRESLPDSFAPSHAGDCQFKGSQLQCGREVYELVGNVSNSRLKADALDPNQTVVFAEYTDALDDEHAVMVHLADAYRHYIESMLEIGLGAATLSFTKFYHAFYESHSNGSAFGKRMTAMFEFLKKDKASMGVQAHYNDALPEDFSQCMSISEMLYVCDNVQQNWIYRKK